MDFNKELTLSNGSGHYLVAFDPSYISKSGRETPGTGMYWSGCAGKCKWGIEIGGIAAIDVDNHTAFHLEAVQTLHDKENDGQTLMDWYADMLEERKEKLKGISKYLVCDAWFSKKPFVDRVVGMDMHIVSRLRDDADLRYLNLEKPTGKKGRPKKYNGKIDVKNPDTAYFTKLPETEEYAAHSAVAYSKAYCDYKGIIGGSDCWEFSIRPHTDSLWGMPPEDELLCLVSIDEHGFIANIETQLTSHSNKSYSYLLKTNYTLYRDKLVAANTFFKVLPNAANKENNEFFIEMLYSDIQRL